MHHPFSVPAHPKLQHTSSALQPGANRAHQETHLCPLVHPGDLGMQGTERTFQGLSQAAASKTQRVNKEQTEGSTLGSKRSLFKWGGEWRRKGVEAGF